MTSRTTLYVAGPMTGYPEWNFPAFEGATTALREAGYEVVSPHEIDLEEGFDPSSDGSGFDLRAALTRDVEEVLDADGVALLDGWEESPGATIEVLAASSQGAPARPVREFLKKAGVAVAAFAGISGLYLTGAIMTESGAQTVQALCDAAPVLHEPISAYAETVRDVQGVVVE